MHTIKTGTLILAIQAIHAEQQTLRSALAEDDGDEDLMQAVADHQRAAEDLERAYDEATKTVLNLPPYNELVGD